MAAGINLFKDNILKKIGKKLYTRSETIAVAESVTSGLLQLGLSSIPDASGFYQGGITAYNIAQKYKHLLVEPIHALSVNCVSLQVAEEMALHVCQAFHSDWGLAVTGYATPVPESGHNCFAYYAIAFQNKIKRSGMIRAVKKDPLVLQIAYSMEIFKRLEIALRSPKK